MIKLLNHFFEKVFEHTNGIVRQPGMNGRGLDDRAALGGQPVEALALREPPDRSGFRLPRADFRDDVEISTDGFGFGPGREALQLGFAEPDASFEKFMPRAR